MLSWPKHESPAPLWTRCRSPSERTSIGRAAWQSAASRISFWGTQTVLQSPLVRWYHRILFQLTGNRILNLRMAKTDSRMVQYGECRVRKHLFAKRNHKTNVAGAPRTHAFSRKRIPTSLLQSEGRSTLPINRTFVKTACRGRELPSGGL